MKRFVSLLLIACMLAVLAPAGAFATHGAGWCEENGRWCYYENGAPLTGVCWIEAEGGRYLFDEQGYLLTGDAEGDVLVNGNLYYINPAKNLADPHTCFAMCNYTRNRGADVGITYYNEDGITYEGWINAGGGRRMYQTCIPRDGKDLYIYVWRLQHLPECPDPDHPHNPAYNIPAGTYLFDDNGFCLGDGMHHCGDGHTYIVRNGRVDSTVPTTPTPTPTPTPGGNNGGYFPNHHGPHGCHYPVCPHY